MSRNSRLFLSDYKLEFVLNERPVETENYLLRLSCSDNLKIILKTDDAEVLNVFIHTNSIDGEWKDIYLSKKIDGEFELNISGVSGGRSAFRFAIEKEDAVYWEPEEYHQLLGDPPALDVICLYTMIPNVTGTISDWTLKLKHISEMGFNAVHVLPFTEMSSSESPYSAANLFKIDQAYKGDIDDFRNFAKEAGRLGIIICLDIVLNHIGDNNIICNKHADWLQPDKDRTDGMRRAGCYHQNSWISWEDLILINYEHPDPHVKSEIYKYMLEYVLFWIDAAGGTKVMLRLDNLHSSNRKFIKWLMHELRKQHQDIIILSEYFGAEQNLDEAVSDYGLNLLTANSWEYPFAPVLENYIRSIHANKGLKYLLTPTSHDTEAASKLFGTADSSIPRYAVCALMGTGYTGIVQGYELGLLEKTEFIGRNPKKQPETDNDYSKFIKNVNDLLKKEKCLRLKGNIQFYETGNDSLIVCIRRSCEGGGILIAVNLDIYNRHSFKYHMLGNAETLIVEKSEVLYRPEEDIIEINLDACGACAVRTMK